MFVQLAVVLPVLVLLAAQVVGQTAELVVVKVYEYALVKVEETVFEAELTAGLDFVLLTEQLKRYIN